MSLGPLRGANNVQCNGAPIGLQEAVSTLAQPIVDATYCSGVGPPSLLIQAVCRDVPLCIHGTLLASREAASKAERLCAASYSHRFDVKGKFVSSNQSLATHATFC